MTSSEAEWSRHAYLLAISEVLCPSLNGSASHRLAALMESGGPGVSDDREWLRAARSRVEESRVLHWTTELERLTRSGVHMLDTADQEYPANLRMVHDRPPFIFVRGALVDGDERAVAVVGTRRPSAEGRDAAEEIARQLAGRHVTVVSGLAEGIDTAAHSGALSEGGRTIAVLGTGIEVVYPQANRALAAAVTRSGACVSQFWPQMHGARWTFPVRNLVTSGLSLGTVVVEAGETSGARLQAEAAVRHGKRVFLLGRLVHAQAWAQRLAEQPAVAVVDSVDEILRRIEVDLVTSSDVQI